MDNLLFANGVPPEKLNFQGCTPGYPASLWRSDLNGQSIPFYEGKVAHFVAESVAQFRTESLAHFAAERVAHFAAESVAQFGAEYARAPAILSTRPTTP
jgi:hypothetical protein